LRNSPTSDTSEILIKIYSAVKEWYDNNIISINSYNNKNRKKEFVEIRQISHVLCKTFTNLSLKEIGANVGNKKHATVINSIKKVQNFYDTDLAYRKRFTTVKNYVENKLLLCNTVYIAGTISLDLKEKGWDYVLNKFQIAEDFLKKQGYITHNPTKFFNDEELKTFTQLDFMSRCITYLTKCSSIYMLKDYKNSYNACIEHEIAKNLNLNVIYE